MSVQSYEQNKNFIWRYTKNEISHEAVNIMHYDSSMVVTCLIRGSGSVFVENSRTELSDGDVIIISPNEFHRALFDDIPDHERISVYVQPTLAESMGIDGDLLFGAFFERKQGRGNVIPSSVAKELGIHALLSTMKAPENEDDADGDILLQCKIVELLLLLKKALPMAEKNPIPSRESKTTTAVVEYINAHLTEELTTSGIADALFLDKSYLCREFKKNTGATISQYVTKKRICAAINLMSAGVSCTDACYRSGFGNYSSFYKYYRRYTDAIPAEAKIKKAEKRG